MASAPYPNSLGNIPMKRSPLIAAVLAALVAPGAFAATWNFDYLSLATYNPSADHHISLVSQSSSATIISLDAFALETKRVAANDNELNNWMHPYGVEYVEYMDTEGFRFNLAPGVKLTGATVTATFTGELIAGEPGGHATNAINAHLQMEELKDGVSTVWPWANSEKFMNLDGTSATGSATVDADLVRWGDLEGPIGHGIVVSTLKDQFAQAARDDSGRLIEASYAHIWASQVILTFHTAPVPEPATYAMFGAGLLMLGASTWRKHMARK
jgi:hypothetical protein